MSQYSIVLLLSGIIPFVLSFWPPLKFWRNLSSLFYTIGLILVIFASWDIFATFRHHWFFRHDAVWKARIINLPLEEVMFFIVIPFCCIFTWEAINYILKLREK
ncbi:MAG: lycopene cyclase domain-containing protein [Candidatus Omnitrophota bacterium]|nr:MAG: lycopene cyclase domain-containing protein [Candidatus Omnitrophota bacterium]